MKIVFTGGVTGGHFYPIVSIVEEIHNIVKENKLISPEIYFISPTPYDRGVLFNNDIIYKESPAGKVRRYASALNFFDGIKTFIGIIKTLWMLFWIYPDIVVGKGGYGSFPTLVAARILGIPVLIHESDSRPGRVNKWASKFAKKIAVSYPEAVEFFPKDKVAVTGNPVRSQIKVPAKDGAFEFLGFDPTVPTILILGGSQGAKNINDAILDILGVLVERFQVIHQTGKNNFKEVTDTANLILNTSPYYKRYKPFDYMNDLAIRMSAGAAGLVISRAGSALFEIANWGIPSIIIPLPEEVSGDQRSNAFSYARSGCCSVIEENNLSKEILVAEIAHIFNTPGVYEKMQEATKNFSNTNAGRIIAEEILKIGISHEK